jgi:predicted amidohydrolase
LLPEDAAANQCFVIAGNVASPRQHCPSMIISPRGEILGAPAREPASGSADRH